jgi:hypothetical protein
LLRGQQLTQQLLDAPLEGSDLVRCSCALQLLGLHGLGMLLGLRLLRLLRLCSLG